MPDNNTALELSLITLLIVCLGTQYVELLSDSARCNNLDDSVQIIYEENLNECIESCEYMDECKLINYFNYFKSYDDSRCYIFDNICDIQIKNVPSDVAFVGYKMLHQTCIDFPNDWSDSIGDKCSIYYEYNWCNNHEVFKNETIFRKLTDTKYGKTGIDVCCECGGGIIIIDDMALSADQNWNDINNDISCLSNHTILFDQNGWDNANLYQLCTVLNNINCHHLIYADFEPKDYFLYSIFICDNYNYDVNPFDFVLEIIVDDVNNISNTYINQMWFNLDTSYYPSSIHIMHQNFAKCVDEILSGTDSVMHMHNYGIHPCYSLRTAPTVSSVTMLSTDSIESKKQNDTNAKLITMLVVVGSIVGLIIIATCCFCCVVVIECNCNWFNECGKCIYKWFQEWCIKCVWCKECSCPLNSNQTSGQERRQQDIGSSKLSELTHFTDNHNDNDKNIMYPTAPLESDGDNDDIDNERKSEQCIICVDSEANMFNYPCGHVAYCSNCFEEILKISQNLCPICKQKVTQCKPIYKAGF